MSSLPEPTPSPPRAVPLGRLLVERGLLTEEQLIEGLLEQDRTGDRLGKVLIDLGFIDGPTVAMALATQHGGPLKTEYGFATGFPPGEPTDPVMQPHPVPDPVSSQPLSAEPSLDAEPTPSPEDDVGTVTGGANDGAETPGENAHGKSGLDVALGELQAFQAEHQRAVRQLEATIAELDAARADLAAADTRISDLEQELAAAQEQLDARRSKSAELEDKLAAAQLAAETAIAALQPVTEGPTAPTEPD
jgi:hypothetical protein